MSRWIDIGYKWNTETAYRVSQFLKENRIPFRMPSDDMFFQSMYHLPHRDRVWGIRVRRRDLARAMSLLEEEGLVHSPARRPGKGRSGLGRQWVGPLPAVRKKWAIPRPGAENT